MNEEVYAVALKNTLAEINNICPDIKWSFIFTNNGAIYATDEQAADAKVAKAASSFQALAEKAAAVGGLDNVLINGEKSKVYVSCVNDMYLVTATSKHADITYLRTVTRVILPTILKLLDRITTVSTTPTMPAPIKPAPSEPIEEEPTEEEVTEEVIEEETPKPLLTVPSQQFIVDKLGGLIVRPDTVQIDEEILKRWGAILNVDSVNEVEVDTFNGKTARYKVKVISDSKFAGRGIIRVPEKACQNLEVKKGELVRVKPVVPESD